jgi:hypothetical protein
LLSPATGAAWLLPGDEFGGNAPAGDDAPAVGVDDWRTFQANPFGSALESSISTENAQ